MAFNAQRNDPAKFTEGAWVDIMGGRFKVARAGNPQYMEALERHGKRKAQTKAQEQDALLAAIADGLLRGWEDVEDAEGNPIAYSHDAAVKVLADNPELVSALLAEANDAENYRQEDISAQAKKPSPSSSTS